MIKLKQLRLLMHSLSGNWPLCI